MNHFSVYTNHMKTTLWHVCFLIISIALILVCTFSSTAMAFSNIPKLFMDEQVSTNSLSERETSKRFFRSNKNVLNKLAQNLIDTVIITVKDNEVIFSKIYQKTREKTSTWAGQDSTAQYRILLTIGQDHFFGRVSTEEGIVVFKPLRVAYGTESYLQNPDYEIPLINDEVLRPHENHSSEYTPLKAPASASDDGSRLDVMVLYTTGMASAHPGTQIETRIQYLIDVANDAFQNSNIKAEINLVYSAEVDYPDDSPGGIGEALDDLTDNSGVFAGVESIRTTYGADQVTLIRKYVDAGCGKAWLNKGWADDARYAYSVVHDGAKNFGQYTYFCPDLVFVHEFGHNLGCAHDRQNSPGPGRFPYSYGYIDPVNLFYTVMAYNRYCWDCTQIPYFSNPLINYDGQPTGNADSEDNARTINQTRKEMALYRRATDRKKANVMPWIPLLLFDH